MYGVAVLVRTCSFKWYYLEYFMGDHLGLCGCCAVVGVGRGGHEDERHGAAPFIYLSGK